MTASQAKQLDPIRKAAILISTLDHRMADELLERMSEEQAMLVRSVAMELDEIPEDEQKAVLQEFLGTDESPSQLDDSGIELDEELARKLSEGQPFEERAPARDVVDEPPFHFLRDADSEMIGKHLQDENPQIIAVVIAHLPPRSAADLLHEFEPELQANLLRRVAELDAADHDIVLEVEKHLRMLMQDDLRAAQNRAIGLSTVSSILTAAGGSRGQLISSLTRHDRQLAHQLRDPQRMVNTGHHDREPTLTKPAVHLALETAEQQVSQTDNAASDNDLEANRHVQERAVSSPTIHFDELSRLSSSDLALVFGESDSKVTLLALAGAAPEFVDRLLKQVPAQESKLLRRRMEQLGPIRLSDIEQAQVSIAEIAARLIAEGQIDAPQLERFAMAA